MHTNCAARQLGSDMEGVQLNLRLDESLLWLGHTLASSGRKNIRMIEGSPPGLRSRGTNGRNDGVCRGNGGGVGNSHLWPSLVQAFCPDDQSAIMSPTL
jgi:hypothetical protein